MSRTDEIQKLWPTAPMENKLDYLFEVQVHNAKALEEIRESCRCRRQECAGDFISKKEAIGFGAILIALFIAFLVGYGILTWRELAQHGIHLIGG